MNSLLPLQFEQPIGTQIGGFVVGHRAKMNRCDAVGTIVGLSEREGTGPVVTLHFDIPQPVDFPEGRTSQRFSMPWRNVSCTWRAPFPLRSGGDDEGIGHETVETLRSLAHQVHDALSAHDDPPDGVAATLGGLQNRDDVRALASYQSAGGFVHVLAEVEADEARFLLWSGTEGDVGVDPWPPGVPAGALPNAFDHVAANDPPSESVVFVEARWAPEPAVATTFPGIR